MLEFILGIAAACGGYWYVNNSKKISRHERELPPPQNRREEISLPSEEIPSIYLRTAAARLGQNYDAKVAADYYRSL